MIVKFYNVATKKKQILCNVRGFFYTEKVSTKEYKANEKGKYYKVYLLEGKDKYCIGTCKTQEDCEKIIDDIYTSIKVNTTDSNIIFNLDAVVSLRDYINTGR